MIYFSFYSLTTVKSIVFLFYIIINKCESNYLNNINLPFKKTYFNSKLKQQRLFLISFGGFRHDFIKNYNLKNFKLFTSDGCKSLYLNPQFPTQTNPNHWSIATGLHVESHGIIANKFYDPFYKEYFSQSSAKWWNESEPIWTTANKHGLKTGVYYWPGSEAHQNTEDDLVTKMNYNDNIPFMYKINQSIKWFLNEDFKLVLLYHNQPDSIAHKYGINSPEFNVTLNQLDDNLGKMIETLKENELYDANDFNVIVLSDHGISNIKKNIFINEYLDEQDAVFWSFSRNLIHLKPLIELDLLLLKLSKIPDITVTLKHDMPTRLNYKSNRRIADVIISAIEGVGFIYMGKEPVQFNGRTASLSYELKKKLLLAAADKASHGYDNIYPNMKGIFLARGAMFKKNFTSENWLDNVDVYPLMCNILAIECETRNGSFDRSKLYLRYEHRLDSQSNKQIVENKALNLKFNIFSFVFSIFLKWCY